MGRARALAAAGVASLVLAGCAVVDAVRAGVPGDGGAETCVSWVLHATPAEAAQDNLAVRGRVVGRAGTERIWGVEAALWELEVDAVLVGAGVEPGERVLVLSTPETCLGHGEVYPSGDPLDVDGAVVVILHDDGEHGPRTVTPFDGVVPPGPDGGLPGDWPPGRPGV